MDEESKVAVAGIGLVATLIIFIAVVVIVLSGSSESTDIDGQEAVAVTGSYNEDWSSLIDGDVCLIDGVPQILSAAGLSHYAVPRIVYIRTNGDVVMLNIPGNSSGVATRGSIIKLASGVCNSE